MIKPDSPVFAQQLNDVRDDASLVSLCQLVEIVLVQADETPQGLEDDFFVTHVSD